MLSFINTIRKFLLFLVFLIFSIGNIFADNKDTNGYSLSQCYQLALKRSYELSTKLEMIHQAEARISQARASFLPHINFNGSHRRQDISSQDSLIGGLSKDTTMRFTLDQSIFKGFKDFAILKQRKLEKFAYQAALDQAKLQVYADVANAFYNILIYQKDIDHYSNQIKAYMQRKDELSRFKANGRARETDLLAVDVSIANLEAQLANSKGLFNLSQESIKFLIGVEEDIELEDRVSDEVAVGILNDWTNTIDHKPSVSQALENLNAQKQQLYIARSGYLPTADFEANSYVKRQGFNRDNNWDILFSFKVPLFTGGETQAEVREAQAQLKQLEVELEQTRQESLRDIRSDYKTLQADLDQLTALKNAVDLGQRYLDFIVKDNQQGLSNNIDVLDALANLYEKKRLFDRQRYTVKYHFVKLQVHSAITKID